MHGTVQAHTQSGWCPAVRPIMTVPWGIRMRTIQLVSKDEWMMEALRRTDNLLRGIGNANQVMRTERANCVSHTAPN